MAPEASDKLLALLGFAMKAGKVRSGAFAAKETLKEGRAFLTVLDKDASENTEAQWTEACTKAGVPLITAEGVGKAIGRESHMIACITDKGFASAMMRCQSKTECNSGV